MKPRVYGFIERDLEKRLRAASRDKGVSRSAIIEAALLSFLSAEHSDYREAAMVRRLDRLDRKFGRLHRDQTILLETLALFIRHYLSTTAPLPEKERRAALAVGKERFTQFIEQLGRGLGKDNSLIRDVLEQIQPSADEFFQFSEDAANDNQPPEGRAS